MKHEDKEKKRVLGKDESVATLEAVSLIAVHHLDRP